MDIYIILNISHRCHSVGFRSKSDETTQVQQKNPSVQISAGSLANNQPVATKPRDLSLLPPSTCCGTLKSRAHRPAVASLESRSLLLS